MLYKKNREKSLDPALFAAPTSEYRAAPFWAWNCRLKKEQLIRQIGQMQKMGFGGFHMHSRVGMGTEYLSDAFMDLIRSCADTAEHKQMLAWLYDEDRWPSGAAGGYVTKNPRYRARHLLFTPQPLSDAVQPQQAENTGAPQLLAVFDIVQNADGTLRSYSQIGEHDAAAGSKWYAYVRCAAPSGWYNNETYVDTLSPEAIRSFIEITHECYNRAVGDRFGKSIPAIFTDEPQFERKNTLPFADSRQEVTLPWTADLPQTYQQACGLDLVSHLPELVWDLPDGAVSRARYFYHDHVTERFASAFSDQIGKWCEQHGIAMTGHIVEEPTLASQTMAVGDAMRSYRSFTIPGIDMLCDWREFTTAKQAQSAAHQYGREGVLSELYGVTNWDFDFRSHKLQGDWQAALGVSVRVPHLTWVSMEGEAKRDYPASLGYQSPWYEQYRYVEDHFARVNTAMTRGRPIVKIGVIHPIESYWLYWGPSAATHDRRAQMDRQFQDLTQWLIGAQLDFDFIAESLLPSQFGGTSGGLHVGEMCYEAVLVPGCETLRQTTVDALSAFQAAGGRLIFAGACPRYVDAAPSDAAAALYQASITVDYDPVSIAQALAPMRDIGIRNTDGTQADNLIYGMRRDNDCRWLFVAHKDVPACKDVSKEQNIILTINGAFVPTLYDTLTGDISPISYTVEANTTKIPYCLYACDSLLLCLKPAEAGHVPTAEGPAVCTMRTPVGQMEAGPIRCRLRPAGTLDSYGPVNLLHPMAAQVPDMVIDFKAPVRYTLSEPNVLLLDIAEYALDGGAWHKPEEILRLANQCRSACGLPDMGEAMPQPWLSPVIPLPRASWDSAAPCRMHAHDSDAAEMVHFVDLRYTITSQCSLTGVQLALEHAEFCAVSLNSVPVENVVTGYFTDEAIQTIALPMLKAGENVLCIRAPLAMRTTVEACYLLGSFGVSLAGSQAMLCQMPQTLGFSSVTDQLLPFYGANITYETTIDVPDCDLLIHVSHYRGALVRVSIDGSDAGVIAYAPYTLAMSQVSAGTHTISFTLFGNRNNTFGALHNSDTSDIWYGSSMWHKTGDAWTYGYNVRDMGILQSPVIEVFER